MTKRVLFNKVSIKISITFLQHSQFSFHAIVAIIRHKGRSCDLSLCFSAILDCDFSVRLFELQVEVLAWVPR